jgi:hypothetical protein
LSDEPEIYELDLDWDLANHLANPESYAYLRAESIGPDHIEDEYIENVWNWASKHYREHKQPPTASVLEAQFDDLALGAPLTAVGDLVQRLRERYVRNYGREAIKAVGEVWRGDPLSTSQALMEAGRELARVTAERGESWGSGDHDRSILEYHRKVAKGPGPSLGFVELDDYFMGQIGVTFWLGAPKSMKTWTGPVKGIIENVRAGREVHAYSLELPPYELNMRVRCMAADVPWWRFLKNKLEEDHIERLRAAAEELDDLGNFHIMKPPMEERSAENLITKAGDAGAEVIYIDQLQYLVDGKGTPIGERNDPGLYWGVGNKLRDYSDDIPIFVVHQFNRSVMFADSMPEMQQAKGGSMIEEVGTLVMGLWSNKDMRSSGIMELGTLASRNYGLASWEVAVNMQRGCGFNINSRMSDD